MSEKTRKVLFITSGVIIISILVALLIFIGINKDNIIKSNEIPNNQDIEDIKIDFSFLIDENVSPDLVEMQKDVYITNLKEQIKIGNIYKEKPENPKIMAIVDEYTIYDYQFEMQKLSNSISVRKYEMTKAIGKITADTKEVTKQSDDEILQELINRKLIQLDSQKSEINPSKEFANAKALDDLALLRTETLSENKREADFAKQNLGILTTVVNSYGFESIDDYYEKYFLELLYNNLCVSNHKEVYFKNNPNKSEDDYNQYIVDLKNQFKVIVY